MERHVVLAHELCVGDVVSTPIGAPPALEQRFGVVGADLHVGPLACGAQVPDRRVEPDVPDLAGDLGEVVGIDRDAPVEVAGDAPIVETFVEPLVGDRTGELRPVGLGVDPRPDAVRQLRLQQEHVGAGADLQVGGPGDGAAGFDQVGGLERLSTVLALVASSAFVAAVRTGAHDVAVGKEHVICDREDLFCGAHLGEAFGLEAPGEVVGQPVVRWARGTPEVVEAEIEAGAQVLLHLVLGRAELLDAEARSAGSELGGGAVLVGGADEQHLVVSGAQVAGVHVGRQHRPDEVAEVLDAVDVRQCAGDEVTGHVGDRLRSGDAPAYRRGLRHPGAVSGALYDPSRGLSPAHRP